MKKVFKKTSTIVSTGEVRKTTKTITLSPVQAKFYSAIMKAITSDPELIDFCRTPLTGKTFMLKLVDKTLDDMVGEHIYGTMDDDYCNPL